MNDPECTCDFQRPAPWLSGRMVCLNCGDELGVLDVLAQIDE